MRADLHGIGVIFDMDGVLVDSFEPHRRSWQLLGQEIGRTVSDDQFAATFGRRSREIIEILFGPGRGEEEIRRLDDRKEELYRGLIRDCVPLMPGVEGALRTLRAAGARLAVGSSGPRENVAIVVEALAEVCRFDAVVCGVDVTRGKPDPQVFQIAAARLGLPPSACVVAEDAPVGLEAAHRAGMSTIALRDARNSAPLRADAVLETLEALSPELVRGLVRRLG